MKAATARKVSESNVNQLRSKVDTLIGAASVEGLFSIIVHYRENEEKFLREILEKDGYKVVTSRVEGHYDGCSDLYRIVISW